ncbi:MAG: Tim44 domain-containing protein [Alphaproteobacteria bacterium GM202ARS2]|nr:Tim44 domain-containing protein [Alphaproteobacteria bacterium GM202ARS2]
MFQDFDLVLLALVAGFLILRLRAVLGERHGADSPPSSGVYDKAGESSSGVVIDVEAREAEPEAPAPVKEESAEEKAWQKQFASMAALKAHMETFTMEAFLQGVQKVFYRVHEAYIKGDVESVRFLLEKDVYERFRAAIAARKENSHRQESSLVGIDSCEPIDVYVDKKSAEITVKIVSGQVNALYDKEGTCVQGDAEKIVSLTDIWVFSRSFSARDKIWYLRQTRNDKPSHDD